MSPIVEPSANKVEDDLAEAQLLSYKVMVSKLNGWQLNLEYARKVALYDELTEYLAKLRTEKLSERETAEKNKSRVERQIEILRERTQCSGPRSEKPAI